MDIIAELKDVGIIFLMVFGLYALSAIVTAPILTLLAMKLHKISSNADGIELNMNGFLMRFYSNEKWEKTYEQPRTVSKLYAGMLPDAIFLTLLLISFVFIIFGFLGSLQGG